MHIGFTGTQEGMTDQQKLKLFELFNSIPKQRTTFHHGCCIGADSTAAWIADTCMFLLVAHPPINTSKISDDLPWPDETREAKDYLVRNREIVDESAILIVTPKGFEEEIRSGTWSTYRYAKKQGKAITIVFPDGTTKEENY